MGSEIQPNETCAQFFRRMENPHGIAVLVWHEGQAELWLHRLPGGAICMDDQSCCPTVPVGKRNAQRVVDEWKQSVEWDREVS